MRKELRWRNYFFFGFLTAFIFPMFSCAQRPLKVFILAGQSNMVGQGELYSNENTRAIGSLEYEVAHDKKGLYKNVKDKKGRWRIRHDVWVRFDRGEEGGLKKGDLSVGYGATDKAMGPEFQFGNVIGDYFSEQVLLIKTAWGGKSLGVDFRPPSSGGTTGLFYRKMIEDIHFALNNLSEEFPQYKNQGYELAGFVWNQGWNDAGNSELYNQYKLNMIHFIKDIRKDLHSPELPFVLINCGQGGFQHTPDKWMSNVQKFIVSAQADAAAIPEFSGNVALVDSRPLWKDSLESPTRQIHHYNRNAGTFFLMGEAAGHAMIHLINHYKPVKPARNNKEENGEIYDSGLMGYISFKTSPQSEGFNSGIGFYSAVYSMLPQPIKSFQIGLASTWIIPDNSDNLTQPLCPPRSYAKENWAAGRGPTFRDVFQTIEGGLGIWGSTQFRSRYTSPKFQIVAVPDCYSGNYLISPGWGNTTTATKDNKMGVAQISNRLLIPPDGITFKKNPNGELFGYAWMSLPFSEIKNEIPPTGNRYWTLFFALSNFKGPVAFIIPESWSKISVDYPFDYNRGLDSRGGLSGGGAQEINTVPYFEMKDSKGVVYSRIPEFLYPVDKKNQTILIQDVRYYSSKALADGVQKWRDGGEIPSGKFLISDSSSVLAKLRALPFNFSQTEKKIALTGIDQIVQTSVFEDSTAFGLKWSHSQAGNQGILPQYFMQESKARVAVPVEVVPKELVGKKFASATMGSSYNSGKSDAWTKPGPCQGPYYADLADGSRVTYYWYRFIDQPSLQQYKNLWSDSLRANMQSLISKIHKNWTMDKQYMPAPADGKELVPIDPALIVKPPPGLEEGYVPIVTEQQEIKSKKTIKQ